MSVSTFLSYRSSPQLQPLQPQNKPQASESNSRSNNQPKPPSTKPTLLTATAERGSSWVRLLAPPPLPSPATPLPQSSPQPTASWTPSATPSTPTPSPLKKPPWTRAPGTRTHATSPPSA